jgi:cobalt-zinc-cadmium efflux system protein
MAPGHHDHAHGLSRAREPRALKQALVLILAFMAAEVTMGIIASSLALLSDAAHMVTDAGALALALVASKVARKPPGGALTYGLGRVEILSAQGNGATLLVLALVIVYEAIRRLITPPQVGGVAVVAVACAGIAVNLVAARILAGEGSWMTRAAGQHATPDAERAPSAQRSLNVEGSYRHVLTDLYGFIATAVAGGVVLATGFQRADAIASLVVAAIMLYAAFGLLKASGRVFMEAAPAGMAPEAIGVALAAQPGVVEVHDLHVWEVTSGFPALSAHVLVQAGRDCHELRRDLQRMLEERFTIAHTTLQVDHAAAEQRPLQIEVGAPGEGRLAQ